MVLIQELIYIRIPYTIYHACTIHTHTAPLTCLVVLSCQSSQFLYCNFDTIVLQTVLSVDVLCGEEIVTQCLIGS